MIKRAAVTAGSYFFGLIALGLAGGAVISAVLGVGLVIYLATAASKVLLAMIGIV